MICLILWFIDAIRTAYGLSTYSQNMEMLLLAGCFELFMEIFSAAIFSMFRSL